MNLKDVGIFKDLSAKEFDKIKNISAEITCGEKQILCKEGDPGDKMYIIISGAVEIKKKMAENQAVSLARLLPGELFGELSFFDDIPRSATVEAMTSAKVAVIKKEDFLKLIQSEPELGLKLVISLISKTAKRLRKADDIIRDLTANLFHL